MKNTLFLIALFSLNLLLNVFAFAAVEPITVKGKITCEGKAVANVPVTDGVSVVKTDKKGRYLLHTATDREFVYYSLPSGYESPTVAGVPVFYKEIDADNPKQKIDFTLEKAQVSQDAHAFIAWADPQMLDEADFEGLKHVLDDMKTTVTELNSRLLVHAVSLGDIVFDRLNYFDRYKANISEVGIPFYQSIGNHDMDYNYRSDELSTASYAESFGPVYYSFNKGKVHYVVLKDVFYYGHSYRYIGYIDERQLHWLEQDLATVKPGSTVVVSLHIPTENNRKPNHSLSGNVMNREALFNILKPYNTHILAGHSHTQWNTVFSPTLFEHVHAAASGAWWQGEICTDGTPKGYTVYQVEDDSLSWYFKGVGQSKDDQFNIYPLGSDHQHPNSVVANVYNYDPSWKVTWYENDKLMGTMEQYWGLDPMASNKYQPGKNSRHSWLSAGETNHLFKAQVNNARAEIKVVVTDRFGNKYEKTLPSAYTTTEEETWNLVWSDEFDYSGLPDTAKWNFATRGNEYGWGNNELQWYTVAEKKNAHVSEGTLKITALREPTGGKEFSSARLTSQHKGDWKYGKVEARAKMPTGRGTWPAIWMMPTKNTYGGWPKSGEIDIMEHVGHDPDTVHSTVHTTAYNHMKGTQVGKPFFLPSATTDFHVYTMEWDENEIRSYVDGKLFFQFQNEGTGPEAWPFDHPFHLILNLAIGGGWGGQKGVDNALFPHVFEIDYVRVYQRN